jgi:hypothetical protein
MGSKKRRCPKAEDQLPRRRGPTMKFVSTKTAEHASEALSAGSPSQAATDLPATGHLGVCGPAARRRQQVRVRSENYWQ